MRLVTKDGIERVVRANPIAGLIAERGVALEALGAYLLVGRCPRHPGSAGRSLLIEPRNGRFRCLVCCLHGGNAIGLVMRLDGLPFMAAVEKLAVRAGLDLDAVMSKEHPRMPARQLSSVPVWALTPPPGMRLGYRDGM